MSYVYASLHLRGEVVLMPLDSVDVPACEMTVRQFQEGAKNPPIRLWTYESGVFDRSFGTEEHDVHDLCDLAYCFQTSIQSAWVYCVRRSVSNLAPSSQHFD
eukprot:1073313-Amphidinium_carterae.5